MRIRIAEHIDIIEKKFNALKNESSNNAQEDDTL